MKVCPTCKKIYDDEELNFCLADGATLIKKRGMQAESSRGNEILAVVLMAAAVLLFLCLISSNASDPNWNTASSEKVHNWIGIAGSYTADLLFQTVGLTAYLVPALFALAGWRVFYSRGLRPEFKTVAGFVLFILSLSGLAALIGWRGGILGALMAEYSAKLLRTAGSAIFLLTLFVAAILLLTPFSIVGFLSGYGAEFRNVWARFYAWMRPPKGEDASRISDRKSGSLTDAATIRVPETVTGRTARTRIVEPDDSPFVTRKNAVIAPPAEEDLVPPTIAVAERPIRIEPAKPGTGKLPNDEDPPETEETGSGEDAFFGEGTHPETSASYEAYKLPLPEMMHPPDARIEHQESELQEIANELASKTREFNVAGRVVSIAPGPVVTTYEFKPDPGVKYSRVTGLVDDLCLALKAESIRIDRIPGKAFVGIEVPNRRRETIRLRDVIESDRFRESESLLTLALGKTIDGRNYVSDLAKMPHLLIAGATGAGKSVGVNTLVVSILYKARPDEVKFIMVDPKRLELGLYADIPHLLHPIIVDPKKASAALKNMVYEMERRYKYLAGWGVRNIDGYNAEAKKRNERGDLDEDGNEHPKLPYIVIIIDELADLMMVSGKEVEESITRLAQMARAVGIHLVLATQRPSVDVITGLIKANFPARISFRVSSKIDSRTIIDGNGAEALLGRGDMLFLPPASSQVVRVHGAYVDEKEIAQIVDHIKRQGEPVYDETITKTEEEAQGGEGDLPGRKDPLFWDAVRNVVQNKRASTSLLQRHLRIGYGRAAAILDAMSKEGYIGEMDSGTRARPVLPKAYEDLADMDEMSGQN